MLKMICELLLLLLAFCCHSYTIIFLVSYDFLVLTTGSSQACVLDQSNSKDDDIFEGDHASAMSKLAVLQDAIANAKSLLVVGGGFVGAEVVFRRV
jgi:NADH dehydrogenase FAD-containing subunit